MSNRLESLVINVSSDCETQSWFSESTLRAYALYLTTALYRERNGPSRDLWDYERYTDYAHYRWYYRGE